MNEKQNEKTTDDGESTMNEEPSQQPTQGKTTARTGTGEAEPTRTPPRAETTMAEEQERPTKSPPEGATSATDEGEAAKPTALPPSEVTTDEAYGTTTWHTNKKITALWSIHQDRNSWIHVAGLGWKKLANDFDSAVVTLTMVSTHAKQTGGTADLLEESGEITEIYVWSN